MHRGRSDSTSNSNGCKEKGYKTMNLNQSSAPSVEPVVTADQKTWMRVDTSDEDTLIGSLAAAARAWFESSTNRQLITASWTYKLTNFPLSEIVFPLSPLQSVTSIKYYDTNDVQQTLSAALYDVDTGSKPGRIRPAVDEDWPSDIRGHTDDIEIIAVCGYGDAASDVPDGILTAIKILAANWFENREANSPISLQPVPMALEALTWQYRDGSIA